MSALRNVYRAGERLYRRLFQRRLDSRTREIVRVLTSVPALEHLSKRALLAMAEAVHRRTYRRGESLYYQSDPGLGLYVVERGTVRLLTEPEPDRTRELRTIEAPGIFGVLSILGDFHRMETAETVTETRALGFFRPDLKNVLRRDPKAGAEITMALARWIAAQHVDLIEHLADREGHETAMQTYVDAHAGE
jgi:CRP-like cAMP-binding protein